jgi:hypothetical protein
MPVMTRPDGAEGQCVGVVWALCGRCAWLTRRPAPRIESVRGMRKRPGSAGRYVGRGHDEMTIAEVLFLVAVVLYLFGDDMARQSRA